MAEVACSADLGCCGIACTWRYFAMFLRSKTRKKDGKVHRTFSVVENRRLPDGRVAQRHVLYLGEINDAQHRAWCKTIEVVEGAAGKTSQMAIFPEDRIAPPMPCEVAQVRVKDMRLVRLRQWQSRLNRNGTTELTDTGTAADVSRKARMVTAIFYRWFQVPSATGESWRSCA